jgi:type II secretory pathway component GspD/PulD (secretin)
MFVSLRILLGVVFFITFCFGADDSFAQGKPRLPWTDGKIIEYNAVDQDLRNLLRSIVRADGGFNIIVKNEVKGQATIQFDKTPVAAAFNQVIEENDLDYTYSESEKTVTIFPNAGGKAVSRVFLTPAVATFDEIKNALRRHGLGEDGVSFDISSNTISITGEPDRVGEIGSLVKQIDAAKVQQVQLRAERRTLNAANISERAKAAAVRNKAVSDQRRADFQQKMYESMQNFKVKLIPLRFASVSSTNKKFQNKNFSVPGIEETLHKVLGLPPPGQPQSETALNAAAVGGGTGPAYEATVMSQLLKPIISVDARTNSVIVRGTDQAIASVEEIIIQLDQPLRMIEVEVAIIKADSNVSEELGVAWRYRARNQNGGARSGAIDTGTTNERASDTSTGLDAISLLPTQGASTVASFIIVGGEAFLQAQISAFAQKNRLQTVASPRVVTLDNVTARVTAATNVYIQTVASGDAGSSVEQIETGLELVILPSIVPSDVAGEQNLVRLDLTAKNSTPSASILGGTVDVDSAEVQTQILIPDGATFIMGGLFADSRSDGSSGVPILKDIPFLGKLFRTNTSSDNLNETIFMITPRIVNSQELSKDMAIRVGTRSYMKHQRDILARTSRELENGGNAYFPNAIRAQEEEE